MDIVENALGVCLLDYLNVMKKRCRGWTCKQVQSITSRFCRHFCVCFCILRSGDVGVSDFLPYYLTRDTGLMTSLFMNLYVVFDDESEINN